MILVVVFILLTYILSSIRFSILNKIIFLSNLPHEICLDLLPKNPNTQPILQALVCGHNFESFELSHLYISSGLIHLFVVSGSHLILIEKILQKLLGLWPLKFSFMVILVLLLAYCFVCQLNPPVVRSFLTLFLSLCLSLQNKHWPRDYILLISGLFCLLIQPAWTTSIGFQMSWLAAIAIHINQRIYASRPQLIHQFTFYSLFIFSFSCLGFPQLSVICISFIFAPLLEFLLLPLAFLIIPFPVLDILFEKLIQILNFLLSHMELSTSTFLTDPQNTVWLNWCLIFILQISIHFRPKKT